MDKKYAIVNYKLSDKEIRRLDEIGIIVYPSDRAQTYTAVDSHPDLQLHSISNKIFIYKNASEGLYNFISKYSNKEIIKCNYEILESYPNNIGLNAISYKNIFLHNTNHTANELLDYVKSNNYKIVNVKQGYTGCTSSLIGEKFLLTNDKKISTKGIELKLKTLYLESGDIRLESFPYGFIGGATKFVKIDNRNILISFGSMKRYKHFNLINDFFNKNNFKIEYYNLNDNELEDCGSMVFI